MNDTAKNGMTELMKAAWIVSSKEVYDSYGYGGGIGSRIVFYQSDDDSDHWDVTSPEGFGATAGTAHRVVVGVYVGCYSRRVYDEYGQWKNDRWFYLYIPNHMLSDLGKEAASMHCEAGAD